MLVCTPKTLFIAVSAGLDPGPPEIGAMWGGRSCAFPVAPRPANTIDVSVVYISVCRNERARISLPPKRIPRMIGRWRQSILEQYRDRCAKEALRALPFPNGRCAVKPVA